MSTAESPLAAFRYEDPVRQQTAARSSFQHFDRLAFAMQALGLFRPVGVRVAVYPSSRLHVQQVRDLARGVEAYVVSVGIPRDASAESIVLALSGIDGVSREPLKMQLALAAGVRVEAAS